MNPETVKKAKETLNELIKNDIITLERDAPEEDEPKITGHNFLSTCQEENQDLGYLVCGGEETESEKKEECNYDLGILFEKEEEILKLKADIKRFRHTVSTFRNQQKCPYEYENVQCVLETCDPVMEVQVIQQLNEGRPLEKFPANTNGADTSLSYR